VAAPPWYLVVTKQTVVDIIVMDVWRREVIRIQDSSAPGGRIKLLAAYMYAALSDQAGVTEIL
jgi:hypothetical protein